MICKELATERPKFCVFSMTTPVSLEEFYSSYNHSECVLNITVYVFRVFSIVVYYQTDTLVHTR